MNEKKIGWILLAAASASIPLILMKKYTETKKTILIILSLICYLVVIQSYIQLLSTSNISTIYPMIKIVSDLIVIPVGIFLFHEKLNLYNYLGIILGIFSIHLLSIKNP
jgi:multidrug transporter EmrE-like cation transporter